MTAGGVEFNAGDLASEVVIDSLFLEVTADGDFLERRYRRSTQIISPDAYRRLTGRGTPDGRPVRDEPESEVVESLGNWVIRDDSIFLSQSSEQLANELATRVEPPAGTSREDLREAARRAFDSVGAVVRWKGVWKDDRLILTDVDGREWVLRASR